MRWLCSGVFVLLVGLQSPAQEISVFDQRKNLPLNDKDTVYHDYYLNAGSESGLKKGLYVDIVRAVPVHDPVQNKSLATMNVPVARVQIVHVERKISVARLAQAMGNDERPNLEYESIMLGDRVDMGSASQEPPKKRKARAQVESEEPSEPAKENAATPPPEPTVVHTEKNLPPAAAKSPEEAPNAPPQPLVDQVSKSPLPVTQL